MKLTTLQVPVTVSPRTVSTKRHGTGELGSPQDLKIGWTDTVWFTGGSNAIGRLDAERRLAVFRRTTGGRPHALAEGGGGSGIAFWFTDPTGNAIGRIGHDGAFLADIPTGAGSIPTPVGRANPYQILFGARGAATIFREASQGVTPVACPHSGIDAVAWGPDSLIWYVSGSTLQGLEPTLLVGPRVPLPAGGRITELVQDSVDRSLYYCNQERDVIGHIMNREKIVEYQLPAGLGPRAVSLGFNEVWFTGRGGRSVFRLKYRQVTEFPCADPSSDLTRLAYVADGKDTMWFTEPGASSISTATLYGF